MASTHPTGNNAQPIKVMQLTYNEIIADTTADYIASLAGSPLPEPTEIERKLLARTNLALRGQDQLRDAKDRFASLRQLAHAQIAQIMISLHRVVRIAPSTGNTDRDYDLLAVYVDEGEEEGLYVTSEDQIRSIARRYDRQLTINGAKEVTSVLREQAPRVTRCQEVDLIAVDNGIFDYATKQLLPFDPERIFLSKSRVAYDPAALSPVIVDPDGDWEVEAWMTTLSDDTEIIDLLWQVLGAIIRPNVRWNRSAWFYSEKGNNGKGTLCELMRRLVGSSSYASIPIADFGKEFLLEPLVRASAIIVDENDVGGFIDRAANLKAVITGDVIPINRKNKVPIAFQFHGFMVQCLNEFPRIKDRSESFYRRQLFVPFTKTFTGRERKAIKEDYLQRPEVLRYVLRRVLEMDYHVLDEPAATRAVLDEYKEFNDPVRSFWADLEDEFVWDLLPFAFLYDLYRAWFAKTNPSGHVVGRNAFISDTVAILDGSSTWYCSDKTAKIRSANKMGAPEHLIATYGLTDWKNQSYSGNNLDKMCTPSSLSTSYRGVQRYRSVAAQQSTPTDDDDDDD